MSSRFAASQAMGGAVNGYGFQQELGRLTIQTSPVALRLPQIRSRYRIVVSPAATSTLELSRAPVTSRDGVALPPFSEHAVAHVVAIRVGPRTRKARLTWCATAENRLRRGGRYRTKTDQSPELDEDTTGGGHSASQK
jgi:hypothetical protein